MPCSGEHDGEYGHGGEAIHGDGLSATANRQPRCAREKESGARELTEWAHGGPVTD